jgi:hypothetical protein
LVEEFIGELKEATRTLSLSRTGASRRGAPDTHFSCVLMLHAVSSFNQKKGSVPFIIVSVSEKQLN